MFIQKIDSYLEKADWRVKENANTPFSFSNLLFYAASSAVAEYTLQRVYKSHPIMDMHRKGQVHVHDLSGGIAPYCAGWSLSSLLHEGFNIAHSNYISSTPAKHFRSAVSHILNFIGTMSNEWMGAQAFSDIDVYLAPYIYADFAQMRDTIYKELFTGDNEEYARKESIKVAKVLTRRDVSQSIQELLYNLNFPARWGGQSPFSNITLALTIPDDLRTRPVMIAQKTLLNEDNSSVTYGQLEEYVNLFNELFFENYMTGEASGKVFTFPIITVNVTEGFFKLPKKILNLVLGANRKFGATYFQNCINGQSNKKPIKADTVRSMCCRLSLDLDELKQHTGGLFGNGEMTGSIGVVTLNLPEIGYICKGDLDKFLSTLSEWMEISADSLMMKKSAVMKNFENGLFPYTTRYLTTKFRTHFLTIGYLGMHEALLNFGIEDGIVSDKGKEIAIEILDYMREKTKELQKKHQTLFNLEAVPAEGASFRLAKASKERIPDIITAGDGDSVYFTNSCHLPVDKQGDFVFVLKHQEELQCRHTGGTVVHFYLDGQPEEATILNMIKKVCSTKTPYFTLTSVFSYCPIHGYLPGSHAFCPYPHTEEQLAKYGIVVESDANPEKL